jgi:deaminated glutathione amidase
MPGTQARTLRISVAQFPVSHEVSHNLTFMRRQLKQSAEAGADLVHFPESSLTGYFSKDFSSFRDLDWAAIARAEDVLASAAAEVKLWVVFGSYRRPRVGKPFNCSRVVSPAGELVETYDKCNLFNRNRENVECSAGRTLKTFVVRGVRCGLLICNDSNRTSLYRRYRTLGVEVLLHSYYNARSSRGKTVFADVVLSQLRTRAFDHGFWISASNSSARYSPLAACLAAPDGTITGCQRHRAGVHVGDVRCERLGRPRRMHRGLSSGSA